VTVGSYHQNLNRIKTLTDPAHRFKVRKNAEQMNLTGVCIFNPSFSMVYVEGAAKYIRNYKRLMLNRIAWTDAARPRGATEDSGANPDGGNDDGDGADNVNGVTGADAESAASLVEAVSLEDNRCWLVWEGQLRDRVFSGFKPKACPTDSAAKEVLGEKLAGYWDQAKNWKPGEEDIYREME
jgi:U4/U6 small nuclear ribonucleoprotein PRP3